MPDSVVVDYPVPVVRPIVSLCPKRLCFEYLSSLLKPFWLSNVTRERGLFVLHGQGRDKPGQEEAKRDMSIAREIQVHLPHLRRYARALLGTQAAGDAFVRACLEVILEDSSMFRRPNEMRITLYRLFQTILSSTFMQIGDRSVVNGSSEVLPPLYRSTEMSLDSRQALLLTTLEGFSYEEAARIMDRDERDIEELVEAALTEIDQRSALRVLIIEDEPIISMDLENLIEELGHTVVGVASTHAEAVELAQSGYPELILADIQLADGSSGLEAAT